MRYFLVVVTLVLSLGVVPVVSADTTGGGTAALLAQLYAQLLQLQTQLQSMLIVSEQDLLVATTAVSKKLPVCDSFTAKPATVAKAGESSTLTWKTSNATKVSINQNQGNQPVDGSKVVKPGKSVIYTLTATAADGTAVTCATKVMVKGYVAPLATCDSFSVSPATITKGGAATVSWATTNAVEVSITGGIGAVKGDGSKSVTPAETVTYKLTAENIDGKTASCPSKTVTVKPAAPSLSFCANTLKTKFGTLCAIQPSKIDKRTLDASPATGIAGRRTTGDDTYGFGYHVFAVPNNWSAAKGVWVHLGGSYSRPYDPTSYTADKLGNGYGNTAWLDELMEQGYAVLQPAYDNRFSVNGDLCGKDDAGYNRNNCAGEVREVGLTGQGTSPYRTTDQYNTIDYRLKTLVGYIEDTQKISLPDDISSAKLDWSKLDISGHSQGADQSYYIAKQRLVNSACFLAGVYDGGDSVKPGSIPIADWLVDGKTSVTPASRFGAFLTKTDDSYNSFNATLTTILGMSKSQIVIDDTAPYQTELGKSVEGHGATVKDPSLKAARAKACF